MTKKRKPKTLADVRKRVGRVRLAKTENIAVGTATLKVDRIDHNAQLDAMRDRRTPRYDIAEAGIAEPRVEATPEDIRKAMNDPSNWRSTDDPALEIAMPPRQIFFIDPAWPYPPSRLPHYLLGILIGFGMCLLSWPWVEKIWTMVGG